jgi:hypothetical protein
MVFYTASTHYDAAPVVVPHTRTVMNVTGRRHECFSGKVKYRNVRATPTQVTDFHYGTQVVPHTEVSAWY